MLRGSVDTIGQSSKRICAWGRSPNTYGEALVAQATLENSTEGFSQKPSGSMYVVFMGEKWHHTRRRQAIISGRLSTRPSAFSITFSVQGGNGAIDLVLFRVGSIVGAVARASAETAGA